MAAVIVPIAVAGLSTLAPIIANLAQNAIQQAEAYFPKGSGGYKMAVVAGNILNFLKGLGASGQVQETAPDITELQPVIEGILATLKQQGLMPAPGSGAAGLAALAPITVAVQAAGAGANLQGLAMAAAILAAITKEAAA